MSLPTMPAARLANGHMTADAAAISTMQALLTEAPSANGAVVAATTRGSGISSQLVIPRPKRSLFEVPRVCLQHSSVQTCKQASTSLPIAATSSCRAASDLTCIVTQRGWNCRSRASMRWR